MRTSTLFWNMNFLSGHKLKIMHKTEMKWKHVNAGLDLRGSDREGGPGTSIILNKI
jgi:hypothetical protein